MQITEQERAFIRGLKKLTRETGIVIHGCGCCGSPCIFPIEKDQMPEDTGYRCDEDGENLNWVYPRSWNEEENKKRIIK